MSNIKEGNRFERRFCSLMGEYGFWVHRMAQNAAGQQPADVIAVKDGRAFLIDCKVCENDRFPLSRMEPNQRSAMEQWMKCGNTVPFFALEDSKGCVWMLSYPAAVLAEETEKKSLNLLTDTTGNGLTKFDIWAERYLSNHENGYRQQHSD